MKRILRITLTGLGFLAAAALLFYAYVHFAVEKRLSQHYEFPDESYTLVSDDTVLARGAHVAQTRGCPDCHGSDLGGKVVIDDPVMGRIYATNLTRGAGGVGQHYTIQDWVRALRHGVGADARPLWLMPSHETTHLTEEDLTALIAYCQSLAPVDRLPVASELGPAGRLLTFFNKVPMLPAELIDHEARPQPSLKQEVSVAYGQYLAVTCTGCHHDDFKGGKAHIPGSPEVSDITRTGNIARWSAEQFIHALRTGKTPEGKQMDNKFMPWQMTRAYTNEELLSLYLFLKEQP